MRSRLTSVATPVVAILTLATGSVLFQPAGAATPAPHFHSHLHGLPKVAHHPKRPLSTSAQPVHHAPKGWPWGVTASDLREWSRVAMCEEGGNWTVRGSLYSGGLGITNSNWQYFSRGLGFPANAADATPVQQVAVAKRINAGYAVPDQNGCHAW